MDTASLIGCVGIYAATFVIAVVGAMIPIVSIEVFLGGLALAGKLPAGVPAIVAIAAVGQVLGKLPVYFATRRLAGRSERVDKLRARVARWRDRPLLVLAASALVGLPPFAIAASAAGVLAIEPRRFVVVAGVGRALRFAAIVGLATLL
jgi:membrane protein YqaA with SNARE-associated domain